jgi:hypothetical protein
MASLDAIFRSIPTAPPKASDPARACFVSTMDELMQSITRQCTRKGVRTIFLFGDDTTSFIETFTAQFPKSCYLSTIGSVDDVLHKTYLQTMYNPQSGPCLVEFDPEFLPAVTAFTSYPFVAVILYKKTSKKKAPEEVERRQVFNDTASELEVENHRNMRGIFKHTLARK